MRKTEFQKIQERHARKMFWRKHKEDVKEFAGACFLFVLIYVVTVVFLCW
jgi:hypothetical protein